MLLITTARKQRKSENSDLGSLIQMPTFMESFNKPAFRSKMTVAFATLSHSNIPCFLSVPEDFSITFFHFHCTTPETWASSCYTGRWDRAPMGFCQCAGRLLMTDTGHSMSTVKGSTCCMHSTVTSNKHQGQTIIRPGIGPAIDPALQRAMPPVQP